MHKFDVPLSLIGADGNAITREQIVSEARSWIGTRFMHQQSTKGVGADCYGFTRGVLSAVGVLREGYESKLPAEALAYKSPNGEMMRAASEQLGIRVPTGSIQPGDFLLMRIQRAPQHYAIVGDYRYGGLSVIHALGPNAPAEIVETTLAPHWMKRIVGAYAIPGIEDWLWPR